MHIELLLEEPSAEAFLSAFLPRVLPAGTTLRPIVFQGKQDLLVKLESRLKGYRSWLPDDSRIVVLVDEDRQDCRRLKRQLESAAAAAGLRTKSKAGRSFTVLNRIAVEELEAWFLGDPAALNAAYPRIPSSVGNKAAFRNPDAVAGGTWEALERVLQRAGYHRGGLPKIELAKTMAQHVDASRNTSASFQCFLSGVASL